MLPGAVSIAGHLYQLIRFIDLEVCQQIQLLGLLNILWGEVCHGLAFLPVGFLGTQMVHIICLGFDNCLNFFHMGTFVMFPGVESIL